jgi:hypothetical protein
MGLSVFPAPASGVTLAEVQTAVSTYSKGPLDITWTNLGTTAMTNGSGSVTISGLSSYKYIKVLFHFSMGSNCQINLRFNGDAGGNYAYGTSVITNGNMYDNVVGDGSVGQFRLTQTDISAGNWFNGEFTISGNTSGGFKSMSGYAFGPTGFGNGRNEYFGFWRNNSAVSSFTLLPNTGTFTASGNIQVMGGN